MELKIFLVAAGCFSFVGAAPKQGKVDASPAGGVYLAGTALILNCVFADGTTYPTSGSTNWKKGSDIFQQVQGDTRVTFSSAQTETYRKATFSGVVAGDTGEYICQPPLTAGPTINTFSEKFSVIVEAPKTPKLTCPTTKLKAGQQTTCTCASTNNALLKPVSYEFMVDGKPKESAGSKSPKDEVKFEATEELNGKDVTCKAKFSNVAAGLSAAATAKLTVEPAPTTTPAAAVCSGEEARVSLMTIGFVLLLSTLLMKG